MFSLVVKVVLEMPLDIKVVSSLWLFSGISRCRLGGLVTQL